MKHRGAIVEKVVRTRISISEFSRRLEVSRRTIYNWFEKDDLSFKIIREISAALDYDFSGDFPELLAVDLSDGTFRPRYSGSTFKTNMPEHATFWKNKYTNLLEVHEAMLRDQSLLYTRIGGARQL